jgi:flagellar hook-length control protein FliK
MAPNLPTFPPKLPAPRPTPAEAARPQDPARPQPTDPSSFREALEAAEQAPTPSAEAPRDRAPRSESAEPERPAQDQVVEDDRGSETETDAQPEQGAGDDDATGAQAPEVVAVPVQPQPVLARPEPIAIDESTKVPVGEGAVEAAVGIRAAGSAEVGVEAAAVRMDASRGRMVRSASNPVEQSSAKAASEAASQTVTAAKDRPQSASVTQAAAEPAASQVDARPAPASGPARADGAPGTQSATRQNAADPLARLMEHARVASRPDAPRVTDPIASRLAEVEGSIARQQVARTVEQGGVRIEQSQAGAAESAAPTAVVSQNAVQPSQAIPTGAPVADPAASPAMPAPDLAVADEPHPAAQLASKGVGILANQRGGAITMRLEPPALGQLRIELQIHQGAVVADFTAATPEARVLLEANLGMLRERLESQGLSVERISVHGGRGTESTAPVAAHAGGDARQEGADARSDRSDRGDRSGTRQDAAGGESRGRRDGDARAGRDRTDSGRQGGTRGFAAALSGVTAQRTEPMRRAS